MQFLRRAFAVLALVVLSQSAALADDLSAIKKAAEDYRNQAIAAARGLDPQIADIRLAEAEEDAGKGRWLDAAGKLKDVVGLGRESAANWLMLSNYEEKAGALQDAASAAYLASGISASDERGKALLRAGSLLDKAGQTNDAAAAYAAGLKLTWDSDTNDRLTQLLDSMAFRPVNSRLELSGETPEACIEFKGALKDPSAVHYQDFVRVEPQIDASYSITDQASTLCISGLDFGTAYKIKLLPGLPSDSGEILTKGEDLDFTVGDRDPSIGFRDSAYVLPRIGSTGVPVITVNTERVSLRLMRINDRKLVDQLVDQRFLINLSGYDAEDIVDRSGELIWKGSMSVENQRNKRVVTAFPIQDVVPETKPGIYVLMAYPWTEGREEQDADSDIRYNPQATQWLVVSDLGMTAFSGADGLTVSVRSLETGQPLNRIEFRLIARNNEVLATATSDRSGLARFDPGLLRGEGGRTATAVMAFRKDGDFSFLDLSRAAFDLSDRGVGGRAMPGSSDLFFYGDRGVYRPGETAHLMALLRDQGARAISGTPVMFRVLRPDGVEASRTSGIKDQGGGFQFDIPIAETARTGNWTVEAYIDPEGDPVASTSYLVEDVVPAQIETAVKPSADVLAPGTDVSAAVSAKFLYGAPAANLPVKADLTIARDDAPFPQLAAYQFGLADEKIDPVRTPLDDGSTDDKGAATLNLALGDLPDTAQPLAATLRVEVYEFGGRPVIKSLKLPIRNHPLNIGIKPLFENNEAPSGSPAGFEVVAVDENGKPVDHPGLSYRFVEEDWDYQWFYAHNSWDYDVVVRDKGISDGKVDVTSGAPAKLSVTTDWGHYRLEVFDPTTGAASSIRFFTGWWAQPGTSTTPDRMQVVADKDLYQAGDDAAVHLVAPFAGQAMVTIATDRVLETRLVDVPAEGSSIKVRVDPQWGAGAYVLVNAFRPGKSDQHGPGRAIGLTWLSIDPKPRQLQVTLTVPDKVLPRGGVDIPVAVSNLSGGTAFLTLAAVDEGILQLTDFKSPDPLGYFFGKRRLGLDIRDLYGQLIDGKEGKRGQIREGGDESGLDRRGAPPEIKLVALFSGLVRLDDTGKATVHFDIPDYNGRLRLMAVAYDGANIGSAEAGLVVRDPVIALSSTPRFLAPGDQSTLSLSIQNLDGVAGQYHVALAASDAVQLGDGAQFDAQLDVGGRVSKTVPVLGRKIGMGTITMNLTGPNGFALARDIKLPVRPAQTPMAQSLSRLLQPGESFTLSKAALVSFLPETAGLQATFSARPNLDVPAVLRDLSHYPYGCLEQTTSIAFPLLYVRELSDIWGLKDEYSTNDKAKLQGAVDRAFEHERSDGMFGLWSGSDPADKWLSAYAMDFLTEAKAQGFQISELGYNNGLRGLQLIVGNYNDDDAEALNARAYALYVLAKSKSANLSDLRYMADTYLDRLPTPIASAQLGAALAISGDMERAGKAFARARVDAERASNGYWDYGSEYYGSGLRDMAALITLLAESQMPNNDIASLLDNLAAQQASRSYLSTQEEAWILRAAHATANDQAEVKIGLGDGSSADQAKPYLVKAEFGELDKDRTVTNKGDKPLFIRATASGVPAEMQPATESGAKVERKLFTLDGQPVSPDQIKQNDIVVAVITGQFTDQTTHRAMVIDLLPAGLEIENERLNNTRRTGDLAWLPELTDGGYSEYRDDRYIAAFDAVPDNGGSFAFAYILRAVTPGQYRAPAIEVEDMYKPETRARGAIGQLTVAPYR